MKKLISLVFLLLTLGVLILGYYLPALFEDERISDFDSMNEIRPMSMVEFEVSEEGDDGAESLLTKLRLAGNERDMAVQELEQGKELNHDRARYAAREALALIDKIGEEMGINTGSGIDLGNIKESYITPMLYADVAEGVGEVFWSCVLMDTKNVSVLVIIDDATGKMLSYSCYNYDNSSTMLAPDTLMALWAEFAADYYGLNLTGTEKITLSFEPEAYDEAYSYSAFYSDADDMILEVPLHITRNYSTFSFN